MYRRAFLFQQAPFVFAVTRSSHLLHSESFCVGLFEGTDLLAIEGMSYSTILTLMGKGKKLFIYFIGCMMQASKTSLGVFQFNSGVYCSEHPANAKAKKRYRLLHHNFLAIDIASIMQADEIQAGLNVIRQLQGAMRR